MKNINNKKLAFLFPGQGCHFIGMGKYFYDNFPQYTMLFEEASEILGFDLKQLCLNGSICELNRTVNMFAAIFTTSVGICNVFKEEYCIMPECFAGHSLGEYSALVCAGVLSFHDSLNIIRNRAYMMENVKNGRMTVVEGLPYQIVVNLCKRINNEGYVVEMACFNSDEQSIISGHNHALEDLEEHLLRAGAKITPLFNSPPAHSSLMNMTQSALKKLILASETRHTELMVISNVDAIPYNGRSSIVDKLSRQLSSPVQWVKTIDYILKMGIEYAIDFAPKAILGMLHRGTEKKLRIYTYSQKQDRDLINTLIRNDDK